MGSQLQITAPKMGCFSSIDNVTPIVNIIHLSLYLEDGFWNGGFLFLLEVGIGKVSYFLILIVGVFKTFQDFLLEMQ